jgi:hypothetical protein
MPNLNSMWRRLETDLEAATELDICERECLRLVGGGVRAELDLAATAGDWPRYEAALKGLSPKQVSAEIDWRTRLAKPRASSRVMREFYRGRR